MHSKQIICIITALWLASSSLFITVKAQQSAIYTSPERGYTLGLDLLTKQKYSAAQAEFDKVLTHPKGLSNEIITNAEYYGALCAINLYNNDAETRMADFIKNHAENPKVQVAAYQLGLFCYRKKSWKSATQWLEKTDVYYLSTDEAAEYYFKIGYSYFQINDLDKATKALNELRNADNKYTPAASYYYAHIEYQKKNYETALKGFLKLKTNETFAPIVPYYVAQIYYKQKKYDELIATTVPEMDKLSAQNSSEVARMLGDAYFSLGQYAASIPFLEQYQRTATNSKPADYYQLGYALYKANAYDTAITYLEKLTDKEDTLAQNALYLMADCYLQMGDRKKARNTFFVASKLNADKGLKEDAFYNYAKVSYEMGFQAEAINAFTAYLHTYPNSRKQDEANTHLSDLFYFTKNYEAALEALDNITTKNENTKRSYQRATYYRGVELFSNAQIKSAYEAFNKSLQYPVNAHLVAFSNYWKAECLYKQNDYNNAIKQYQDFLYLPQASTLKEFAIAQYNIGYCYYRRDDYSNAITWFRKYCKDKTQAEDSRFDDALLRIADCYFVQKDYASASDYYGQAIKENSAATDYALFQKATIQGINNDLKAKIASLQLILINYKLSPYYDDALYEMASAEFQLGDNLQALNLYADITDKYKQSSYVKKALLGIGLIYYNEKRDEKALEAYKQVVSNYPGTEESKEALNGIKNIYVGQGNADAYLKYATSFNFANVTDAAQDSLLYESAELRYRQENCEQATQDFEHYLQKYPNGNFAVNAHFYKADCELKAKNTEKALEDYSFIANKPKNNFTEKSLLNAASITYKQKQYDKALGHYQALEQNAEVRSNIVEALAGQMRTAFLLNKYPIAIEFANKLIEDEKVNEGLKTEAHLINGKALLASDSLNAANEEFATISKTLGNDMASEAKYYMAFIQYKQAQYKLAEKTIFFMAKQSSSDYWVAKAYILLADNYTAQNDLFQAKATLKSIIENYDGAELRTAAQQKLDTMLAKEKAQQEKEFLEKQKKNQSAASDSTQQEIPQPTNQK